MKPNKDQNQPCKFGILVISISQFSWGVSGTFPNVSNEFFFGCIYQKAAGWIQSVAKLTPGEGWWKAQKIAVFRKAAANGK